MGFALLCLAVFVAAFLYDFLNTRYITAVAERKAHKAAVLSIVLWGIGATSLLSVIKISLWLLIPEAIGLYAGTLCALRGTKNTCAPSL